LGSPSDGDQAAVNSKRDGYVIWQALSRFSPDVFAHPVWIDFINNNRPIPDLLIQDLQDQYQKLIIEGDIQAACQVLLLCAVLHKRQEKYEASLDCLQRAWELADSHKMPEIVEWAAWGSCALHILLRQPDQAVNSLRWLSSQLSSKGDWVLADLVELFATEITDRAKGIKSVEIPLDWLLKWGEMPVPTNGHYPDRSSSEITFLRSMRAALSSFLTRVSWHSVWLKLKTINIPIVTLSNGHPVEQYPRIDVVAPPLNHKPSRLPRELNASDSPSVQMENFPEKRVARAENGKILLTVYCLGQFRVSVGDQWISSWPSGKGKSILKFMVANYPRPISKDVLMDTLWREADPVAARNSLYVAIYGLRQAFKAVLRGFNPVLFEDDHYLLNPEMSVWQDVEEFVRLHQAGQELEQSGKLEETIQVYESAANLYQGDFLADDLYEDWPVHTRERLRITYLDTLDRLSRIYFNEGQYLSCVNLCHIILTRDNCREDAHRRLMRCYGRQGQYQLALSQFQACVEALRGEMDVDPEPITKQLAERIRLRESV
jgi:DNA-binding SARP family transcriptional activator